ncbi:unnamed protein product [Aphanomyces euteiches]
MVRDFLQKVPIPNIFQCFQEASESGATKQVKLVCQCLERIFRSDIGADILFEEEILPFLVAGVSHNELDAKRLTLDMIDLHLTVDRHWNMDNDILLQVICDCLLDEDSGAARKAGDILFKLVSASGTGLYHKILSKIRAIQVEYLSRPSRDNSVEYVRLLELTSKCAGVNDVVMNDSISLGLLQPILDGIKSTDALFLLNFLDIIPNLCTTKTGLAFIFHSDLLSHLIESSTDPFVGGGALRLIGKFSNLAASHHMEAWNWAESARSFLAAAEMSIQSPDSQQQIAAMDALAVFASASDRELSALLAQKTLCESWLTLGKSSIMEVKSTCFCSLATILACNTRLVTTQIPGENATVWQYHRELLHALGAYSGRPSTMHHLMDCLRQPFEPIRVAVYTLLQAVAVQGHPWGVETLHGYGGLIEYLVDRTTEPSKSTREWKFAIVDALLASPFQHLLGARAVEELNKYFTQGPYAGRAKQADPMLESM